MNKKAFYTSPEVDVLVVQPEGVVCQSGNFGIGGFTDDGLDELDFDTYIP